LLVERIGWQRDAESSYLNADFLTHQKIVYAMPSYVNGIVAGNWSFEQRGADGRYATKEPTQLGRPEAMSIGRRRLCGSRAHGSIDVSRYAA
jgi:hypothetical protein